MGKADDDELDHEEAMRRVNQTLRGARVAGPTPLHQKLKKGIEAPQDQGALILRRYSTSSWTSVAGFLESVSLLCFARRIACAIALSCSALSLS